MFYLYLTNANLFSNNNQNVFYKNSFSSEFHLNVNISRNKYLIKQQSKIKKLHE